MIDEGAWGVRFGEVRAWAQAPYAGGAAGASAALLWLYRVDAARCAEQVWPYMFALWGRAQGADGVGDGDGDGGADEEGGEAMIPEQRERIEDVKVWVLAQLERAPELEAVFDELARGAVGSSTSYTPPRRYGSDAGEVELVGSPLCWQFLYEDFWTLIESHRAAIYSALKMWRR